VSSVQYWIEPLMEPGLMEDQLLKGLMDETDQPLAITVPPIKTARSRK
jgi:hypothetical protein